MVITLINMDDIGKKSLMENDGGKPDGEVGLLEEAGVLVEKSNVGAVNSGINRNDYGYIDDKHDGSKNRVVELMSGDVEWGMMDLVGRMLNEDFGRGEVGKGNVSEDQPQINLVVDLGTIGESTSVNAEGNGLCLNPDMVTNKKVPDENSEIEGLNITKVNIYNKRMYVEDPRGGTTLNAAEGDVCTDNRTGKQDVLTDDIMQAEKSVMEAITNCKADKVKAERNGGFCISDLVWGKVKGHPWWPGQIFAPSAASDKALKYSKKDNYLTTYFGYQNFSWNNVSKIKPFQVNFTEMVKQSNSKAFSYAVNCAVDEVSRRVELGLSCPCLRVDVLDQIKTQVFTNAGIREESIRIECQDNSFTAASFLPRETLQLVESFAVMPNFVTDRLQFAISKAQLLAFDRWRGVYQPSMFEHCGFLLDDGTHFTREVEVIDPMEVNEEVPAASDIAGEIPFRKRKHMAEDDKQIAKRMGRKRQESIVSGSKEKRKHSQFSPKAITQSDAKESKTLEMIQLLTLTPDESVEKLNSATKIPLQEHDDTMMQAVNFLRKYRNFTCVKNSSAYGETGHKGENKGKTAAYIFGFESIKDSYVTDRVIQSMTLTPDRTIEKMDLAAKKPMEDQHDDMMRRALNFLREYQNLINLDQRSIVQPV